jgi:hypothetical protein
VTEASAFQWFFPQEAPVFLLFREIANALDEMFPHRISGNGLLAVDATRKLPQNRYK